MISETRLVKQGVVLCMICFKFPFLRMGFLMQTKRLFKCLNESFELNIIKKVCCILEYCFTDIV
ncbi:hypothetical protein Hanom_Chr04g00300411 [Helianthus anomalus]